MRTDRITRIHLHMGLSSTQMHMGSSLTVCSILNNISSRSPLERSCCRGMMGASGRRSGLELTTIKGELP
eukprot:SAG31_NODE_1785_length_7278_cov_4.205321_9_plen_70_part_00